MAGLDDWETVDLSEETPLHSMFDFQQAADVHPAASGEFIETAETFYGTRLTHIFPTVTVHELHQQIPAALWAYRLFPPQDGRPLIEPRGLSTEFTAQVMVNQGRWLIRCPLSAASVGGKCFGAQHAAKSDPRFYCTYCLNEQVAHAWLPVVWPTNTDEIEAVLLERPFKQNRNWLPGETMQLLRAEPKMAAL